jgi:hypothetical protein
MGIIKFDMGAAMRGGGGAISESGVYYGKLTAATIFTTSGGAGGVEFAFKADDGRECKYIKIITRKKDGGIAFGFDQVQRLMGLFLLESVESVIVGEDYNGEPVEGIPALCNRPIGVVLQRENYWKNNGDPGYKMNVLHFIDPKTNKTYTETRNGAEALAYKQPIEDRMPNTSPVSANSVASRNNRPTPESTDVPPTSVYDDDLPF